MKEYTCPACGKTAFPGFIPNDKYKLVVQCANIDCNRVDGSLGPSDFSQGIAVMPTETSQKTEGRWTAVRSHTVAPGANILDLPTRAQAPVVIIDRSISQTPFSPPSAHAPGDVLSWIEDRALWLAAEEARIAGAIAELQSKRAGVLAEKKQLDKMLKSARREPRVTPVEQAANGLRAN